MKKTFLVLVVCCCSVLAFAQSATPTVIATQGDFFTSTSGEVSWTLGEIATETLTTGSNSVTQGFQQPDLRIDNYIREIDGSILSVYPNPALDEVIVDLSKMAAGNYLISVFNTAGQLMSAGNYSGGAGASVNHLSLKNYAGGNYLLMVASGNNKYYNSIKIIKAN